MKKLFLISALLCIFCNSSYGSTKASSEPANLHEGHEWVDLGLPSGLKWATCNVGASSPEDYGDYYAWGELSTKDRYTESNCSTFGKSIGDISGNPEYDVARAKWGGSWRMPTKEEFEELKNNCKWEWTTKGDHSGFKATGPNGNSIFLPAAGFRSEGELIRGGKYGYYFTSTPSDKYIGSAITFYYTDNNFDGYFSGEMNSFPFDCGRSVRPVLAESISQSANVQPASVHEDHEWVDLGLPSGLKWATCNVGAWNPEDQGNYYAWGEVSIKYEYTESNCSTFGKSIGDISGNPEYDVARAKWGGSWRMPTQAELLELKDNCIWQWTTKGDHGGYMVTGPNGNSIFLPAAGYCDGAYSHDAEFGGYYWSATPNESNTQGASFLYLSWRGVARTYWRDRGYGHSVRPVSE